MALTIKQNFVIEDINDENGNKLGEIKFNPNDSRIMAKLSKIVKDLDGYLKDMKKMGEFPNITDNKINTYEDFEKISKDFEKIYQGLNLEENAIAGVIEDLSEIFGKNTIDLFTGGTMDIMSLMPLIEFVIPYVKEARESKINQYIVNNNEVMK